MMMMMMLMTMMVIRKIWKLDTNSAVCSGAETDSRNVFGEVSAARIDRSVPMIHAIE